MTKTSVQSNDVRRPRLITLNGNLLRDEKTTAYGRSGQGLELPVKKQRLTSIAIAWLIEGFCCAGVAYGPVYYDALHLICKTGGEKKF